MALCDNIDTRSALDALRDIVTAANIYLRERKPPNQILLYDLSIYVTKILNVFGTTAGIHKIGRFIVRIEYRVLWGTKQLCFRFSVFF